MSFLLKIIMIFIVLYYIGLQCPSVITDKTGTKRFVPNKLIILIIIFLFTFFAAIRSNVGDTGAYMHSFNLYTLGSENPLGFNKMFSFVFNGLAKYIWDDPQILVILTSIIIYPSIIWRMYKNSINPIMSIILFVLSVSYVSSMNGIRQYLVSSILFLLYPWILKQVERKKHTWLILVILLAFFHSTVMIMIPIFMISNRNPFEKKNFLIYLLIIVGILCFNIVMPSVFNIMESAGLGYAQYQNASYGTLSVNPIRILFAFIPVFLYAYLKRNKSLQNIEFYFIGNMTIFNALFMMLAYYGAVYARFCIYFEFYPMMLYPILIKYGFKNNGSQSCAKIILYTVYFLFMYYQIQIAWGGFILKSNWLGLMFGG